MDLVNILSVVVVVIASIMYASLFEWTLHKYVMHNIPFGFRYAYRAHHEIHHRIFGAGRTYELHNHRPEKVDEDRKTIPMAWWNWIVLLIIATLPVAVVCLAVFMIWWPIVVTSIVFFLYYCTYEYFHWCMHDPKGRWFENRSWFIFINNHHRQHHKNPRTNLNVVWPFADWLIGTLVR
jgi:hypothetical protein